MLNSFGQFMTQGGVVMWVLLAMSLTMMIVTFDRIWFWYRNNGAAQVDQVHHFSLLLRQGQTQQVRDLAARDSTVYGRFLELILSENINDALIGQAVEEQRTRIEKYMTVMNTVITAAPMLGILGTVLGIISSFEVLADTSRNVDPRDVGQGIAQALMTTAGGLVVAIMVLLPYNVFRVQIDRTLGRMETLIAAATSAGKSES